MRTKVIFVALAMLFFGASTIATAQQYEIYDGDGWAIRLTVTNGVANKVDFSNEGGSWINLTILDTKNWNGQSTNKECLFSFYLYYGRDNYYQIDYYRQGYINYFQTDSNFDPIYEPAQLFLRKEKKASQIMMTGLMYDYDPALNIGCLFVNDEMVKASVAKPLGKKLSVLCFSDSYGQGALISFRELQKNSPYSKASEGVMMDFTGSWTEENQEYMFIVKTMEPTF